MEDAGPVSAQDEELAAWQASADLLRADLVATTGLDWSLAIETIRWDFDDDDLDSTGLIFSHGSGDMSLPSRRDGSGDIGLAAEAASHLAEMLAEDVMEHFERPWPECPVHHRPMDPQPTSPTGSWMCGKDPTEAAPIGALAEWLAERGRE